LDKTREDKEFEAISKGWPQCVKAMRNETLQSVDGQKIADDEIYRFKKENPARPVI
jgi:hypothetical protein